MEGAPEPVPRPFSDTDWPRAKRSHARALWNFHLALTSPAAPALEGSDLTAYFQAEQERARGGSPLKVVPQEIADAAYLACTEADLPLELLALQIGSAQRFMGPIRFSETRDVNLFTENWAGAHARLLAHLAGVSGSWQLRYVNELARGFFWVGRLVYLKEEINRDWIFIPESDLELNRVTIEQLREGRVDENMKRLLWKQTIRAKDSFAQGEPLARELPRRYRNALKQWWLGGLELIHEIERRGYDVWSEPIKLSTFYRIQVRFQARLGRTTFRSK